MPEFKLLDKVKGYFSKIDKTNAPEAVLVPSSQNVLINDGEKVATRGGYTIFGAAGSGSSPIESAYDWQTSTNTTLSLRSYDDELEFLYDIDTRQVSSGPNSPDSAVNTDAGLGADSDPWTNPSNVTASDDVYATCSIGSGSQSSDYLDITDFDFLIPSFATITGIEVQVEAKGSVVNRIFWKLSQLIIDGTASGTNLASSGESLPASDTIKTFGGDANLWGNTLTPVQVNSSNFGVRLQFQTSTFSSTVSVDHVQIVVYYTLSSQWIRLLDSWTAVDFSFAQWWSATELINELLFVNGTDKIQEWSGGITTFASATTNTITKQGTGTWAASRFLTTGTTLLRIKDTGGTWREFTYTGGETTTTLTGVTPDPTGFTFAVGEIVVQSVRENDNEPIDGATNDFIWVDKNQVHLGSITRNQIYISKDTDFTDYAFSTPRLPGEGALLILDSVGRGFLPSQGKMLIAAGRDDWYYTDYEQITVGTTLAETLKVIKLKTSPGMAAQSQDLISGDMFVSFEPKLRRIVGMDENFNLITEDLSDPIKSDFDLEDFTNGHIKRHRNRTYICSPVNSIVWINEERTNINGQVVKFWQPPQILPIRRFAIIGDLIYGHSSGFNETYKLFDGLNDNGNPRACYAFFSYRNYGDRALLKRFDQWLTEGYIRGNTIITHQLRYEFQGAEQTLEKEINGTDETILFDVVSGMTPLGTTPLGIMEQATQQPKFRQISEFAPRDFFEIQSLYYSSAVDDQWEILAQGPNVSASSNKPTNLTR